jgi:hypothetical protein
MRTASAGPCRALILAILLASCSSGGTGPASGNLNVTIGSLQGDEGAVLFTITGGPVESVQAVNGAVYTAQIDPNTLRVVVIGNLSAGTIARVRIADLSQAAEYSAAITQVAVRSTYAPRDPALYPVTLAH